ncbi:PP2D1 protein, partial [Turnix velox]|nr:PP2D1 protein [Turnix velox]
IVLENDDSSHISIFCSVCGETIYPHHLLHHKKIHRAQTLLGFAGPPRQADSKTLLAQRQKVISQLTKIPKYSEAQRQKVDYSFEFLTDVKAPTPCHDLTPISSPCTFKKVNNSLIKALAICQDQNSTWQAEMEDRFIVLENYGNRSDTCFLGLADGSHGVAAAETVAAELPLLFLDQLAQMDPSYKKSQDQQQVLDAFATVIGADYKEKEKIFSVKAGNDKSSPYERIHKAFAKSFWRMDRLLRLGRRELSKVRWSGCSALTCLLETIPREETEGTKGEGKTYSANTTHSPVSSRARGAAGLLHVANVGDAHVVLCRNGKSHCLSAEHSTSNARERKRILQQGGHISTNEPNGLVEGYLRTTRALGHHGDPVLKRSVVPVPHTLSVPIDDTCQFLILASNGLWEVLDYKEVLTLTLKIFTCYLKKHEFIQQNTTPLSQYLMPLSEGNTSNSKATENLQDGTETTHDSGPQLAEKVDSQIFGEQFASDTSQELRTTVSPASPNPALQLEEDTQTYPWSCKPCSAGRGGATCETLYEKAAGYISKQLVKMALAAGSRDNITILIVLLNGCDKI